MILVISEVEIVQIVVCAIDRMYIPIVLCLLGFTLCIFDYVFTCALYYWVCWKGLQFLSV